MHRNGFGCLFLTLWALHMTELHLLSVTERELFFDATVEESRIPFEVIEKDFWVVWILDLSITHKSFNIWRLDHMICSQ